MAWLFGRRPSNELNAASAKFKANLNMLMKSNGKKNAASISALFNNPISNTNQTRVKNSMIKGLTKRIMKAAGLANAAQVAAATGAISQAQAVQQVNLATAQIKNIVGQVAAANYIAAVNNKRRNYKKNKNNFGPSAPGSKNYLWWMEVNSALAKRQSQPPPLGPVSGAAAAAALPPSGVTLPNNVKKASNANAYFKKSNNGSNTWFPAIRNRNTGNWIISPGSAPHKKLNNNRFEPIGNTAV